MDGLLGEVRWRSPRGLPCAAALTLAGNWIVPPYLESQSRARLESYLADALNLLNSLFSPRLPLDMTRTPPEYEDGMAELRQAATYLGGSILWHRPIGTLSCAESLPASVNPLPLPKARTSLFPRSSGRK